MLLMRSVFGGWPICTWCCRSANDCQVPKCLINKSTQLLKSFRQVRNQEKKQRIFRLLGKYYLFKRLNITWVDAALLLSTPAVRTDLRIQIILGTSCQFLRFKYRHLFVVQRVLQIPESFKLKNRCRINGQEALLFLLYRIHYPETLQKMEKMWGREYSQLSRIFSFMIDWVYDNWGWMVTNNLAFWVTREKCQEYNRAVHMVLTR